MPARPRSRRGISRRRVGDGADGVGFDPRDLRAASLAWTASARAWMRPARCAAAAAGCWASATLRAAAGSAAVPDPEGAGPPLGGAARGWSTARRRPSAPGACLGTSVQMQENMRAGTDIGVVVGPASVEECGPLLGRGAAFHGVRGGSDQGSVLLPFGVRHFPVRKQLFSGTRRCNCDMLPDTSNGESPANRARVYRRMKLGTGSNAGPWRALARADARVSGARSRRSGGWIGRRRGRRRRLGVRRERRLRRLGPGDFREVGRRRGRRLRLARDGDRVGRGLVRHGGGLQKQ